jgi:hypothetical protein
MDGSLGVTKPHNFQKSLKKSHMAEDLPFWNEIYQKAFPSMVAMINHRQDGEHQRAGIDRSIILANSKQLLIDEKTRFKNEKTGKVYTDIALEYWSDVDRKIPGWVCKPLRADYIAYAIAPLGICYLLPVIQLQEAWKAESEKWIKTGPIIKAENEGWTTISVGVNPKILFPVIGRFLRVYFEKYVS